MVSLPLFYYFLLRHDEGKEGFFKMDDHVDEVIDGFEAFADQEHLVVHENGHSHGCFFVFRVFYGFVLRETEDVGGPAPVGDGCVAGGVLKDIFQDDVQEAFLVLVFFFSVLDPAFLEGLIIALKDHLDGGEKVDLTLLPVCLGRVVLETGCAVGRNQASCEVSQVIAERTHKGEFEVQHLDALIGEEDIGCVEITVDQTV